MVGNADPQALILYAQAEAQRLREKVGTVSRIKCAHLTVHHVAHYRADLASPPKKTRPANGRGRDPRTDIPRYLGNGPRARYKPRGSESWPSTRVRQLPSSNGVRDGPGCARTWPGLKPRSRGTPGRIRG
jgi:hypothetical protein